MDFAHCKETQTQLFKESKAVNMSKMSILREEIHIVRIFDAVPIEVLY